jgi:hypothetical protein
MAVGAPVGVMAHRVTVRRMLYGSGGSPRGPSARHGIRVIRRDAVLPSEGCQRW